MSLTDWGLFVSFTLLAIFIIGSTWQGIKGEWQYRKLEKRRKK